MHPRPCHVLEIDRGGSSCHLFLCPRGVAHRLARTVAGLGGLEHCGCASESRSQHIATATPIPTGEPPRPISAPASATAPEATLGPATPSEPASTPTLSLLQHNQAVVLYGLPGNPDLGVLGALSPEDAADTALRKAAEYDAEDPRRHRSGIRSRFRRDTG
jgi:hypothetical protein